MLLYVIGYCCILLPICIYVCILTVAGEFCPGGEPIKEFNAERESDPSVYDDLTMEELAWVQKFMMRRQEFPIVELLVAARDSIINCTYIYHIERLPPSKAEALAYVDHNAPKPKRFALVIMYRFVFLNVSRTAYSSIHDYYYCILLAIIIYVCIY